MKKTIFLTTLLAWPHFESLQLMKTRLAAFRCLLVGCFALATTTAFAQTGFVTHTWTGASNGTNIATAGNWSPATLPNSVGGDQDIGQWDNQITGDLTITYTAAGGLPNTGYGSYGVNWNLTANQVGSVSIIDPLADGGSGTIAVFGMTNNSTSAAFKLGDATAHILNLIWRPGTADTIHGFVNNSASANIIYPNVRVQSGGGIEHILSFGGTGNWYITNNLICANNAGTLIHKDGTGTMYWGGPSISGALGNSAINSPITIIGGTLVLQNNTVLSPAGVGTTGSQNITNSGLFEYDAPLLSQTLSGVISGTGALQVNNGTLTLSGANIYTGSTTLSGGSLVLNRAENAGVSGPVGVGGSILFTGGTLQFSANNTYDYSSRFSGNGNQTYVFDTSGQSVTFATGLGSSSGMLTKANSGVLTLAGTSSYDGLTTVSAGKLVFQGSKTGSGNITVANSAALGVTATGTQVTPGTLILGTSSGVALEFNNVSSTSTAIIAAGAISAGGTVTVNINSGTFAIGQSYPLLTWSAGSAPTVLLGTLTGASGNLSISGNTLYLNITSIAYVWSGLNSGNWDTTTENWLFNGVSSVFANGGTALFDDTAAGQTNVTLNSPVSPESVTVNSSSKTYSITSSGANLITGSGGLTKNGNSTLTLSGGVNTFSGVTTLSGGVLSVSTLANGGAASDIGAAGNSAANLVFNGGTLLYTNGGAASSDRLFTLTTGGGTINASGSGALNLNNSGSIALSGNGNRVLTLTGTDAEANTLAAVLGDNGGTTALAKTGAGKWILSGNNTNSGTVTISAGTLQVGAGGASGTLGTGSIVDNGRLNFNVSGTLTVGTVSGTGSVTNNGSGTVVLPGNNSYSGGTTINAGVLQVGNGGATGTLAGQSPVVNNGTFIYDSTGSFSLTANGLISGTGNVIVRGSGGLLKAIGNNTYTGWTTIDPGATFQPCEGNQGALVSPVITNNGTLKLVRQDLGVFVYGGTITGTGLVWKDVNNANYNDVTLTGTNTYTGGTIICGGAVILGDGINAGAGSIVGNVFFTNSPTGNDITRTLQFNRPDSLTFPGNITYSTNLAYGNRGALLQNGSGTLTLTGNNTYPGGTTISNGVLQVGAGGTSGSIGTGPVVDNTLLVFNRSDSLAFGGVISGTGSVVKNGSGTLTLTATNTYFGTLTVSNGTLLVNGQDYAASITVTDGTLGGTGAIYGPVTLAAGTKLAPGATSDSIGTFTIGSDLIIGGDVAVKVNKSLAQSNDLVVVSGALNNTGTGKLTVANLGSALTVGDQFTLFSQPVVNGDTLTITGAGATWINNLAVDGSITVLKTGPVVNTNAPIMQAVMSGNTLSLAWPTNLGWTLQTNSVGLIATNQWYSYPGSATLTNVNITIVPAQTNVFFRMVYTNTP
jgi:autotransporter-associated beta strand protein